MNNIPSPVETVKLTLREQFAAFETKSRSEFDENGWSVFTDKINEYINDLYVGTRRECISRLENEITLKFSGKDAERRQCVWIFNVFMVVNKKGMVYKSEH